MRIPCQPAVSHLVFLFSVACVSLAGARDASAQPADAIGVRAQGMGGAFTAVSDDATASWWNPAGLAGGAYFNALIEGGTFKEPPQDRIGDEQQRARRADTRSFAVAFPALGLSYYRLRVSEIRPVTSTEATPGVRQEGGATEVRLRSLVLNQFGTTVGQSLGSHFVIGSTFKLVNGGTVSAVQPAGTGSLDDAADLDPDGETHAGLDVGAMAVLGPMRVGVMVRNAFTEPEFFSGTPDAFTLSRTVRMGAAASSGTRGVIGAATVAFDTDLTTTATVLGDERRMAVGGEVWTPGRTLGARAGFGWNTIGLKRTTLSGGVSAGVKKGMFVDGELSGGTDLGRKGWAVALRVTF